MKRVVITAALALGLFAAAAQAEDANCKKVRFADVGWTDIQVTTATTQIILEALGYSPEIKTLAVPVTYASLKNKDIDVFLGNWMPSMTADIKAYTEDKSVETIGTNLDGRGLRPGRAAVRGRRRRQEPHRSRRPQGQVRRQDLRHRGRATTATASSATMIAKTENKLDGFELVESSEAGMLTQAEKAMKKNEWIVFLGWTPHPIMGEMKIHYLDGMGDSGFGAATVHTNVRAGYLAECPNVGKLLNNLKFNLAMEGAMMGPVLKDGADPKATALTWLKANPDAVTPWLAGVTTIDGRTGGGCQGGTCQVVAAPAPT